MLLKFDGTCLLYLLFIVKHIKNHFFIKDYLLIVHIY